VWVQVEDQGKMQAIVIADTGAGIPPQDLPRLFERHYRGVQAQTTIPGSGLGLAIARELLHAMQADIEIFSPAPTCGLLPADYPVTGTAVVVWLPTA
jgi:signal transduction histidine kinase